MNLDTPIFVTSPNGLIGAAIVRRLAARGHSRVIPEGSGVDLRDLRDVRRFLRDIRAEVVIDALSMSGGIDLNQRVPADLMVDNLMRTTNLVHASHLEGVTKLLYLASCCAYPKLCPQPMRPEHLLTGPLEPTNEPYGVAKLAGLKLCQSYRQQYGDDYIVGIPANPYGVGDDFSTDDSHVVGALIRKMHDAKLRGDLRVDVWGTGAAVREFIFADDLAEACIVALERYSSATPLNLGNGESVTISALADEIREVVGFRGQLRFDHARTDGMPLKSLDSSPLRELGWRPTTSLRQGLEQTYGSFLASRAATGFEES